MCANLRLQNFIQCTLSLAFLALPAFAQNDCPKWLAWLRTHNKPGATHFEIEGIKVVADADFFSVEKAPYQLSAILEPGGVLDFSVRTKQVGYPWHPDFRGKVLFAAMLEHFGSQVKAISGFWVETDPDMAENYNQFVAALAAGKTEEQAALSTWTGERACQHGFCVAKIQYLAKNRFGQVNMVSVQFLPSPKGQAASTEIAP